MCSSDLIVFAFIFFLLFRLDERIELLYRFCLIDEKIDWYKEALTMGEDDGGYTESAARRIFITVARCMYDGVRHGQYEGRHHTWASMFG